MKDPHLPHWEAVIRIMRHPKAHPSRDLLYKANGHLRVKAFLMLIGQNHRQIETPQLSIALFQEET